MLAKKCQRHHSFLQPPKFIDVSTSGAFLSDSIATTMTSSGYSTGGSSLSTTIIPPQLSSKHSSALSIPRNQQKIKSKDKQRKTSTHGFSHFVTKLKSFITSPKTKLLNSSTSKKAASPNMILQCSTSYHHPLVNNTISLPFTYYQKASEHQESYVTKSTNFEKISAWLDHTEILTQKDNELLFIDECQQDSRASSPVQNDYQILMKKTSSSTNRTPKRSTSMVATMTRPVIEQKQYEKTISPTYSFSSSILTRGMAERLTPQIIYHQPEELNHSLLPKSNRRRAIDFTRRRTVGGINEEINQNNKENLPINPRQQIYRFSPATSTNTVSKKYFFHSNPPVKNEDILMNSYGLTILQQRQSIPTNVKKPQIPTEPSSMRMPPKQVDRRAIIHSKQSDYTSDLMDDILCDREVESYFYPTRRQSPPSLPQHTYMNFGSSSQHYHPPSAYIHSTLC